MNVAGERLLRYHVSMRRIAPIVGLLALLLTVAGCCPDGSDPPCRTVHYKVTQYDDSGNTLKEWIVQHNQVWASEGSVRWSNPDIKNNNTYVVGNVVAEPFFAGETEGEH